MTKETRDAILQWIAKNPLTGQDTLDEYQEHSNNGCRYGQPSGPDDFINDCECEELGDPDDQEKRSLEKKLIWADILRKEYKGE